MNILKTAELYTLNWLQLEIFCYLFFSPQFIKKLNGIVVHRFAIFPLDSASPRPGLRRLSGLQGLRGTCGSRAHMAALSSLVTLPAVFAMHPSTLRSAQARRDGGEQGAHDLEGDR